MNAAWVWCSAAMVLLLLVLAYKVGRLVLRILVGLAVLALLGWGFWHFLLK